MSQAVQVDKLLFVSGQVAYARGEVVGERDPLAQAEQVFRNLCDVLQGAGASFDDVVKLTCFLVSPDYYDAYATVKRRYVASEGPAGTAVIVAGLMDSRLLMEVEAIAVVESE